ncbi:MAG TPA: hypothetical protein VIM32_01105 [Desulfosporosinus sp.]
MLSFAGKLLVVSIIFTGQCFPEPKDLIGEVPLLPGVDGRKMSKSYHNAISLTASTEEVKTRVQQMVTDPARLRKDDPRASRCLHSL